MSLFTRNTTRQRPRSPSLESVLSTTQPSTVDIDQWVIFSPQASGSEVSSFEQINDADLELPTHNGHGSFPPEVPNEHLMDRVNRWSTEQSRIVYEELQRLEHRFLWVNQEVPEEPHTEQPWSWRMFAQRVHSLIALDDEVLDLIFGDGSVTPKASSFSDTPQTAFERSKAVHPNWDDKMVRRVLGGLGVRQAPNFSLLREILGWGLEPTCIDRVEPLYTPTMARDYWEDECSSLSTGLSGVTA